MSAMLLLWLYGLSAWGAVLNCPAWARLAWRRWRDPARASWWRDTFVLARTAIAVLSLGVAGLAGTRIAGALFDQMPIAVPAPIGVLFIGFMAAAEPLFLRVDEIHQQARSKRSLAWRLYWAGLIAWTLALVCIWRLP